MNHLIETKFSSSSFQHRSEILPTLVANHLEILPRLLSLTYQDEMHYKLGPGKSFLCKLGRSEYIPKG